MTFLLYIGEILSLSFLRAGYCSIHFTVTVSRLKNIVRFTADVVITSKVQTCPILFTCTSGEIEYSTRASRSNARGECDTFHGNNMTFVSSLVNLFVSFKW